MHSFATKKELKKNAIKPPITTLKHAKQTFVRFLKERNMYGFYVQQLSYTHSPTSFERILLNDFFFPFKRIIDILISKTSFIEYCNCIHELQTNIDKLVKLQQEWLSWLRTLNLDVSIPEFKVEYYKEQSYEV